MIDTIDILIKTEELPWVPLVEGIDFKLLRSCETSGTWSVYFRMQAGASFPLHKHYGAGEYFVIKGRMKYRAGEAVAGDYGYEPLGSIHELTEFPEYTELYFTNFGPVIFMDEEGNPTSVLDNFTLAQMSQDAMEAS